MTSREPTTLGALGCTLVLGDELDVAAVEILSGARAVRLTGDELRTVLATAPGLDAAAEVDTEAVCGVVVFDPPRDPRDPSAGAVRYSSTPPGPEAPIALAGALAWEHVVTGVTSCTAPLTRADAEALGPVAVAGRPLLTQLLADRRRGSALPEHERVENIGVLSELAVELHRGVRLALAELAAAPESDRGELLSASTGPGGVLAGIRQWLAVEELLARAVAAEPAEVLAEDEGAVFGLRVRTAAAVSRVDEMRGVVTEVLAALPDAPGGLRGRVDRRASTRAAGTLADALGPLAETLRPAEDADTDTDTEADTEPNSTFVETRAALAEADAATDRAAAGRTAAGAGRPATGAALDHRPTPAASGDDTVTLSTEEMAEWLGELFGQRVAEAREEYEAQRRRFPSETPEAAANRLRREAVATLDALDPTRPSAAEVIRETIVDLVLGLALVRGLELDEPGDYRRLGRRVMAAADVAAAVRIRAHRVAPVLELSAAWLFRQVQRRLVETLFAQLGELKPSAGGALRPAYKQARRRVWALRHDEGLRVRAGDAIAGGVVAGVDRGGNRLLVWQVARAVR